MQHLSRYGTRLFEEEVNKKRNNSDFWLFQVCHFKVVTIHIAITTADWGRLYKLLDVLLDASICSLVMISLWKR